MKSTLMSILAMAVVLSLGAIDANAANGGRGNQAGGFVDQNGDGYNDNAPDADGDGIPNGQDPDYVPPLDCTGNPFGNAASRLFGCTSWLSGMFGMPAVAPAQKSGPRARSAGRQGPGDGTGNGGVGPADGTGNGNQTGDCDGTGPRRL